MSKHKSQDTVVDPNERMVSPRNTSRSYARGGGVMREVMKQHREAGGHHIAGGAHDPHERTLDEHGHDVEQGGEK